MWIDHINDKMAKDYFNKIQLQNIDTILPKDNEKVWLDNLLSNEIDLKTFKTGIDVLLPDRKQKSDDLCYV